MNQGRFHDKVVLVTGAAQGIGRRVAERIKEEGGRLLLVDRAELVHELADERTVTITADLETYEGATQAATAAANKWGRIDVLINNVGGTIWTLPYEIGRASCRERV